MDPRIPSSPYPRIVVLGGGFGGLSFIKAMKNKPFQVVLLDRNNYHTFQPLLYQVAIGGIEPDSIAFPYRKIFDKHANLIFRMAEVKGVNVSSKEVHTDIGNISYDYLVIATGSKPNFFGQYAVEENSMPLKSIPQALDVRSLFFQNFEKAIVSDNDDDYESLIDMVIVGGGPTGVEMAGALAELRKHVLPTDYTELDFRRMDIYLVEAGPRLLAGMSEKSSADALKFLENLGVSVLLNTSVTEYDGRLAKLSNGRELLSTTLIWAAGVQGNVPQGISQEALSRGNRLQVNEFLQVKGMVDVFAIGDVAAMLTEQQKMPHVMVAPVAIQQGKLLAQNLLRTVKQKAWKPFVYQNQGAMATIGRHSAVVEFPYLSFSGIIAWFVWLLVHLMALVGFRNKVVVFLNWAISYLSYDYSIHLIIRPFKKEKKEAAIIN